MQFNGQHKNTPYLRAIKVKFKKNDILYYKIDYFSNNWHRQYKGKNGTQIQGIFDLTIELYMEKYILGEILSSGGATLYKNPSDQTV